MHIDTRYTYVNMKILCLMNQLCLLSYCKFVIHGKHFGPQREYEEFKVRINALVAKAQKIPEEGWTMQDGTPWPGNNPRDHPGMIQVLL